MPYYLITDVEVAKYITHPISLVAYVAAIVFSYLSVKNNNQRKQIQSASEKDRASVIIRTAETLHIDLSLIAQKDRKEVVLKELTNRIRTKIITAIIIILLGLFATYLVTHQIDSANQQASKEDSTKNNTTQQGTINQTMEKSPGGVQIVGDSNKVITK